MTSRTSAFPDRARPYQQRLERHLDALFSLRRQTAAIDAGARQLEEAMAYSSLGGGKRTSVRRDVRVAHQGLASSVDHASLPPQSPD